jgi:hypothetical protein
VCDVRVCVLVPGKRICCCCYRMCKVSTWTLCSRSSACSTRHAERMCGKRFSSCFVHSMSNINVSTVRKPASWLPSSKPTMPIKRGSHAHTHDHKHTHHTHTCARVTEIKCVLRIKAMCHVNEFECAQLAKKDGMYLRVAGAFAMLRTGMELVMHCSWCLFYVCVRLCVCVFG